MEKNRPKWMEKEAKKEANASLINVNISINDTDIENDDLNTAFLTCKEEDVDEEANKPTQFTPSDANRTTREENKENEGDASIDLDPTQFEVVHKSPSALMKSTSAWLRSKRPARTETKTRLFATTAKLDEANVLKTPEKPCRESNRIQMVQQPFTSKIKTESVVESKHKPIDDTVIDLTKEANEIITINKSPPILMPHMLKPKKRTVPYAKPITPVKKMKSPGEVCEDCYEYHRKLGRDMDKNPPKKFGICSKHHRNAHENLLETPPGFWNPKIIDSESDHEETPFEYRFAKKLK